MSLPKSLILAFATAMPSGPRNLMRSASNPVKVATMLKNALRPRSRSSGQTVTEAEG